MYISLKAFTCSTLGTLLLLSILSDTPVAHARSLSQRREDINTSKLAATAAKAVDKRDLLGELIPTAKNGDPSSPASAPAAPAPAPAPAAAPAIPPSAPAPSSPPPAPVPEKKDPAPASDPAPSSPQKTQGGPGLVEQLLGGDSEPDPPKQESTSSSPQSTSSTSPPATSADRKKKPTQATGIITGGSGSSRTDDDSSPNGGNAMTTSGLNGDQDPATATSGVNGNNKNAATTPKEGLSSGIVAMIVLVVLGLLAAILLSCYRIRQSRVRRKEREECWDENILKNHVGTVGYNGGTNGSISGGSNGVGSIDVKSEALGDGGCHGATIEAAYAGRGSLGGSSLRDNQSVAGGNVYGGGGTYSPYSQHAHTYSQGFPQQQQGYGGGGYGGTYY